MPIGLHAYHVTVKADAGAPVCEGSCNKKGKLRELMSSQYSLCRRCTSPTIDLPLHHLTSVMENYQERRLFSLSNNGTIDFQNVQGQAAKLQILCAKPPVIRSLVPTLEEPFVLCTPVERSLNPRRHRRIFDDLAGLTKNERTLFNSKRD